MNFSVPDDVREAFNREFAGQNKSAVITKLIREAVAEEERRRRRLEAIRLLTERRKLRPAVRDDDIRRARGRQVASEARIP
jgi:hypothetical protein